MAAQLEHTNKSSEPGCLSFKDLADVLSAQKSVPSLAQLDELIDRTKIGAEEVQPYLGFKADNYSRHRVMKNEFVEMLVLCWKPGKHGPAPAQAWPMVRGSKRGQSVTNGRKKPK